MRSITCKNSRGNYIVFGETAFAPFLLAHVDGLYNSKNELSITENAMLSGGDFQGSRIPTRNIVLTVTDKPHNRYAQVQRDALREVFTEGERGTLIYEEDGSKRCTDYYVESIEKGANQLYIISLLCPDPYFYDVEYSNATMSAWMSNFEFPHEFKAEGEEIGYKNETRIIEIRGISPSPVGMIMEITANGPVKNPSVVKISTGETIALGTELHPLNMLYGDKVTITTEDGKKNVTLTRDGETTSINQYMTEDSVFFQITNGANFFGYAAEEGVDDISFDIYYRNRYEGA